MDATSSSYSYSNALAAANRLKDADKTPDWPIDLFIPQLLEAPPQRRERMFFLPVNERQSTNGNRLLQFKLTASNFADFRRSYLRCAVKINTTDGTYKSLPNGAWNIFKRCSLKNGKGRVFDYDEWGLTQSMAMEAFISKDVGTFFGSALWGYGLLQAKRRVLGQGVAIYELPLMIPALTQSLIPLGALNEEHILEFELDSPQNYLETDATTPQVEITQAQLAYDAVQPQAEYMNMVWNMVDNPKGFPIDCRELEHFTNYVTGTNTNLEIDYRGSGVEAIFSILRDDAIQSVTDVDKNDAAKDRIYRWTNYGMIEHSVMFNNRQWPSTPIQVINGDHEPWIEYLKSMGKFHVTGQVTEVTSLQLDSFLEKRFLIVLDLTQHPGDPAFINPFSTVSTQNTLFLKWKFAAAPAGKIRVDTWVKHAASYSIVRGRFINNNK